MVCADLVKGKEEIAPLDPSAPFGKRVDMFGYSLYFTRNRCFQPFQK